MFGLAQELPACREAREPHHPPSAPGLEDRFRVRVAHGDGSAIGIDADHGFSTTSPPADCLTNVMTLLA